jgi:hypothetical protein
MDLPVSFQMRDAPVQGIDQFAQVCQEQLTLGAGGGHEALSARCCRPPIDICLRHCGLQVSSLGPSRPIRATNRYRLRRASWRQICTLPRPWQGGRPDERSPAPFVVSALPRTHDRALEAFRHTSCSGSWMAEKSIPVSASGASKCTAFTKAPALGGCRSASRERRRTWSRCALSRRTRLVSR